MKLLMLMSRRIDVEINTRIYYLDTYTGKLAKAKEFSSGQDTYLMFPWGLITRPTGQVAIVASKLTSPELTPHIIFYKATCFSASS